MFLSEMEGLIRPAAAAALVLFAASVVGAAQVGLLSAYSKESLFI